MAFFHFTWRGKGHSSIGDRYRQYSDVQDFGRAVPVAVNNRPAIMTALNWLAAAIVAVCCGIALMHASIRLNQLKLEEEKKFEKTAQATAPQNLLAADETYDLQPDVETGKMVIHIVKKK